MKDTFFLLCHLFPKLRSLTTCLICFAGSFLHHPVQRWKRRGGVNVGLSLSGGEASSASSVTSSYRPTTMDPDVWLQTLNFYQRLQGQVRPHALFKWLNVHGQKITSWEELYVFLCLTTTVHCDVEEPAASERVNLQSPNSAQCELYFLSSMSRCFHKFFRETPEALLASQPDEGR